VDLDFIQGIEHGNIGQSVFITKLPSVGIRGVNESLSTVSLSLPQGFRGFDMILKNQNATGPLFMKICID